MSSRSKRSSHRLRAACALGAVALLALCTTLPGTRLDRRGEELVACGELFHVGSPVVLWTDAGGYDAYRLEKRFRAAEQPENKARYGLRGNLPEAIAARVAQQGWELADLQQVVHQFVLHFDAAGTSRRCFEILQDVRNLSVHFMLDVDGTIYQTLDLKERAWHATIANDFAIGIEIAHPGAWSAPRHADMMRWYERDEQGWRMKFPGFLGDPGVRTPDFVPRPARPEPVQGKVHGKDLWQFDYTPQQYRALARLTAALSKVFPRIRLEVPRNPDGTVRTTALPEAELRAFEGIVGHLHVQSNKVDPGPAMDWEGLLREARSLRD